MLAIFTKEISSFFSSLIGYMVIGIFLLFMGLIIWVFPDYSVLYYAYASLDSLFEMAPVIFIFLIPAICMRSFAEEQQNGTIELLSTKPLTDWAIVGGKYLACLGLITFALIPTLLYYYTVYQLGSPPGNIDNGEIAGSYLALLLLAASFASIGVFASSMSKNQIVAFVLGAFLCFVFYWAFIFTSKIPVFVGKGDSIILKLGIDFHYRSMARGIIDSRDVIYFFSIIALFLLLTHFNFSKRKLGI